MKPKDIKQRKRLDRRLGIKSSIPKPQTALAACYLVWKALKEKTIIEYCEESGTENIKLRLPADIRTDIEDYWRGIQDPLPKDLCEKIESSPLFTAQLEHLQVLFSLFWKIAKLSFVDDHPDSLERTGNNRYKKSIDLSANIDLLDLILCGESYGSPNPNTFVLLYDWLSGKKVNSDLSNRVAKVLTILSEDTWFKHDDNIFIQEGIYETLIDSEEPLVFSGEKKGPLRILNRIIEQGMHWVLENAGTGFSIKVAADNEYFSRVSNLLDICAVNSEPSDGSVSTSDASDAVEASKLPRNLILYGAPGTGKSHSLKQRLSALNPEKYERITFYSDYSYSQFVGGYKPVPVYIGSSGAVADVKDGLGNPLGRPGNPAIEYSFVPGPLLRQYTKAMKNPDKLYLVLIEELNRADAASVFGDFFQLLDRRADGTSVYPIQLSKEAQDFLSREFSGSPEIDTSSITLPGNLYLWATLNSADQGVFPIDTAFKRRWEFEYLPLNANQSIMDSKTLDLAIQGADSGAKITIPWNQLRDKINKKLEMLGIQEDLMIGPFFLTSQELDNDTAFKHKLLAYLRDDILRHQYQDFFRFEGTLAQLINRYEQGENIFQFDLT